MARSIRDSVQGRIPEHSRRRDLVPPERRPRDFKNREAQRHLQNKERRWAPIAYGVFLLAVLSIFAVTYTTYAFSKYRGVILPGVYVDQLSISGMSEKQAIAAIDNQLAVIHRVPVRLTYSPLHKVWEPSADQIGLAYNDLATAQAAMTVGREGNFFSQLLDRLPLHPQHDVPLVYTLNERALRRYLNRVAATRGLYVQAQNASLERSGNHFILSPMVQGRVLDVAAADDAVHAVLGSLSKEDRELQVRLVPPVITDSYVVQYRDRVEHFLAHTPTIRIGKSVIPTTRDQFAPMISFHDVVGKRRATIVMTVDTGAVQAFVSTLANQIDRTAQNPTVVFSGGAVQVTQPLRLGRKLDQATALSKLLTVVGRLKSNAHLRFTVATTQPPVDLQNPASLGISTLLGEGVTSFQGAGPTRLNDIVAIAQQLDSRLLQPGQDISFNTLVSGQVWPNRVYRDQEQQSGGQLVPGAGGGMEQVATTFLRALYQTGLPLEERHAHRYRLPWYEPPVGLDALVSPARGWDLRFANSTGKYLLIQTHVEPIRQEVYVYVYGPKLGWHVSVDTLGTVKKVFPHGPTVVRQDSSLAPGVVKYISWPHDGAQTVVQRTITYPSGKNNVKVDEIDSLYVPWQGIIAEGTAPAPSPSPTAASRTRATATVNPTAPPAATPTPTFSH